ncbi:MAG TPA: GNAT family N-acetyltransferase [Stellaceae bacterium]|nr:GNAT family N-acetyltransferase [Stellaceae bacterium]
MADARPLTEADLPEAQRIVRRAFGTFFGAPDLDTFWTDFDYIYGRHDCEHTKSFAIDADGKLAGSNFATRWGSVGFFGPLSIHPELWNRGLAQPLVAAASDQFEQWGLQHAGLCTFPHSTKHIHLYQKFGFHPRFLSPVMAAPAKSGARPEYARYTLLAADGRAAAEEASLALTGELYDGLDLRGEIRTNAARGHGDTLLLWDGASRLGAFAVCHWGPVSEAGADTLFIKFGAARSGPGADERFTKLLDAAGALAVSVGMKQVLAGVSTGREEAQRQMTAMGFRALMNVVTMHRPNEPGYNRPGVYALDDWR